MRKKTDVIRDGPIQAFDFTSPGPTRETELGFRREIDECLESWEPRFPVHCGIPALLRAHPHVLTNLIRDYEKRGLWSVEEEDGQLIFT